MKSVITPAVKEHSVYFSDFTGKCFGTLEPDISVKIEFNYGSKYDSSALELHLTDEEFLPILNIIKANLTKESKSVINFLHKK